MIQGMSIAVVIPAYRVAREIGGVLTAMPPEIDAVYVVDDASPDDLAACVLARGDPRVRLIRNPVNLGVGATTVRGYQEAIADGWDVVVKCDGDGQMDPALIPALVRPIVEGHADHAKGNRLWHFPELRGMPLPRLLGNIGLTILCKLATGYWNVVDPVNGFLATRASMLRRLPLLRLAPRYFFETDLLVRLNILGARVADVPFPARYEGAPSSLSVWRELLRFPPRLIVSVARRVFWRYLYFDVSPVAIFGITGFLLLAFSLGFGAYEWLTHAMAGVATPLGTIMLVALPVILGFQLCLQAIVLDIQNTPRPSEPEVPMLRGAEHSSSPPLPVARSRD